MEIPNSDHPLSGPGPAAVSRRSFLHKTAISLSSVALGNLGTFASDQPPSCPIAVFSKVYQELKLNFADAAAVSAEAGLNGVDCPVREGGEISPEAAADQMPRYAEILAQRNLRMWLLTTGISSPSSPFTESILKTARGLGIKFYRLGFVKRDPAAATKQMAEVRSQLKELAPLNRQLGLCALLQNHSPSGGTTYFGGDLDELRAAVEGFDPDQIGVAFDIGHALVVHGAGWKPRFEALRPHFKIAYVKDVQPGRGWVRFGQGEISRVGYFEMLKRLNYHAPLSLHVEFDWSEGGKNHSRSALVQALQASSKTLRGWLGDSH
jgi:sugar phosphate isomerase/epimerase